MLVDYDVYKFVNKHVYEQMEGWVEVGDVDTSDHHGFAVCRFEGERCAYYPLTAGTYPLYTAMRLWSVNRDAWGRRYGLAWLFGVPNCLLAIRDVTVCEEVPTDAERLDPVPDVNGWLCGLVSKLGFLTKETACADDLANI